MRRIDLFLSFSLFLMLESNLPYLLTGYWPKYSTTTTKKEATNLDITDGWPSIKNRWRNFFTKRKMLNPKKKTSNFKLLSEVVFWRVCGPFPVWTITLLGENLVLLMTFAETGVLINASIIRVHDCLTRFISDMSIQFVTCPGNETCFYFDPFVFENLMMFIHPYVNVVYTFVCVCVCV